MQEQKKIYRIDQRVELKKKHIPNEVDIWLLALPFRCNLVK